MTEEDLRDCFAMFAMLGIMTTRKVSEINELSDLAYNVADAMIYSRKKKEKENEEDTGIAAVVPKRSRRKR